MSKPWNMLCNGAGSSEDEVSGISVNQIES